MNILLKIQYAENCYAKCKKYKIEIKANEIRIGTHLYIEEVFIRHLVSL